MKIAHLSDVHFGRIAYPEIVDVIVAEVNAMGVDLVVISGDLTQRARPRQFEEAVAMIEAFEPPVLVVPGNHDVYAWWHQPFLRLFRPLRRYHALVARDLMPTVEIDGVAVLGINSAYGWTIKGGWIGQAARERVVSYFADQEAELFKILVVHHHLLRLTALGKHDVARHAERMLASAARAGVDLVLCGHLHVSHVAAIESVAGGRRLVIASAGTASSNRWRDPHRFANDYNVIDVGSAAFTIEERRYHPEARQFRTARQTRFDR